MNFDDLSKYVKAIETGEIVQFRHTSQQKWRNVDKNTFLGMASKRGVYEFRIIPKPMTLFVVFNSSGSFFGGWESKATAEQYVITSLDARYMRKFVEEIAP